MEIKTTEIFSREHTSCILLVGKSGTGKTTVLNSLLQRGKLMRLWNECLVLSSGEWLPGAIEFFLPKDIKTTVKVIHGDHPEDHLKDLVRLFSGLKTEILSAEIQAGLS